MLISLSASRSRLSAGTAATLHFVTCDTLSAIARRYHTTVAVLQRLNNITDPKKLRVGQVLKLP